MKKWLIIILIVIIAGLIGVYIKYKPEINFFFYEQTVKNTQDFKDRRDGLKQDYFNVYKRGEPDDYMNLGAKQFGLKDFKSAEQNFLHVIEKQPLNIVAMQNLIRTYEYSGQLDKAEEWGLKLKEKYPTDIDTYMILGELYQVYMKKSEADLANFYADAYKQTNKAVFILLEAGAYERDGNYRKAVELNEKWLSDPQNTQNRILIEGNVAELKAKIK